MSCSHWCRGESGGEGADGLPGGEGVVRGVVQGGGLGRGRGDCVRASGQVMEGAVLKQAG